jgi:hypothetical protein
MLVRFKFLNEKVEAPEVLKSEMFSARLVQGLLLVTKLVLAGTTVKVEVYPMNEVCLRDCNV